MSRVSTSICSSCLRRAGVLCHWRGGNIPSSRRSIGLKYLQKKTEAEEQWQAGAATIRDGQRRSMLSVLEERGFVDSIAGCALLVYICGVYG